MKYLQALAPGPRVLNYYNWGGYLMLHAPEFKLFIDGRANTIYDERVYKDYLALIGATDGLPARLALYAPDVALLPPGPLARTLVSPEYGWTLLYLDEVAAIMVPPRSPLLEPPLSASGRGGRRRSAVPARAGRDAQRPEPARRCAAADRARAAARPAAPARLRRPHANPPRARRTWRASRPRSSGAWPPTRASSRGSTSWSRRPTRPRASRRSRSRPSQRAIPRGPFARPESVLANVERLKKPVASR